MLKGNGNVDCYGHNGYGQAADYTGGDATAVSAGYVHTCVLKSNGNVDCYGSNYYAESVDYTGGDATAVSTGHGHTCMLKSNRDVDCYGYNESGQAEDWVDGDDDGVTDDADSCPEASNPNQEDLDGDAVGDACDSDADGDGKPNPTDSCPAGQTGWGRPLEGGQSIGPINQ